VFCTARKMEDGMRLLRIAVGTTNPCKIEAVRKAIQQSIETTTASTDIYLDIQGFSVESGVPDQPFGDVRSFTFWFSCCSCAMKL